MTIQELSNSYEVESIYEYIIESILNGQIAQARELFQQVKQCSNNERLGFISTVNQYDESIRLKVYEILI